ncbi:MAG: hypothetical protein NXI19_03075 [Alphaproteobacteria bacterium]|nr:hypothetical protein [Alphaproteobacteria bacterium]
MSEAGRHMLQDALQAHRAGFPARAARLYRRVPQGDPLYPDALTGLARARLEQGWTAEAARFVETSLQLRATQSEAWQILAEIRARTGQRDAAARCFRRSALLSPQTVRSQIDLAKLEAPRAPIGILRRCHVLNPLDPALAFEIASDLWARNDLSAATAWFRRHLALRPADLGGLFSLGNVERDGGRPESADRMYRRTLAVLPGSPNVLNNRGFLAFERKDWAAAADLFAAAGRAGPTFATAWSNRARALQKLGRDEDAVLPYKRGLLIDPTDVAACCEIAGLLDETPWARRALAVNPSASQPYNRLALLGTKTASRAGVLDWLRRGAVVRPDEADTWFNICVEFGRDGHTAEAATYGHFAALINPRHAGTHLNTAFALLALERFREGWDLHRRRMEVPEAEAIRRTFSIPEWTDEDLSGRHLLLWGEQGIGDEVQFLTLVPQLADLGATLTIITEPRLRPILRRSFPSATVPEASEPMGTPEEDYGADLHLALGDLPHRLGLFCGGAARPTPWIVPDPERVAALRSALEARHPGKRLVGITWRSIAPKTGGQRTIAPSGWRALAEITDIAVVSLQYGAVAEDVATFAREAGLALDLEHRIEPFEDLDGLAALVAAMDLVICPANNTVHFAGALSKPCWTLLPARPDWRWGLSRADSLWYPNTTVYRQGTDADWDPVMRKVSDDLNLWAERSPHQGPGGR